MDNIIINGKVIDTEVAITEEEHRVGLMYRHKLPSAMAFPFKRAEHTKFWMYNTPCPLDIVFSRKNKIIYICAGKPYSLNLVGPDEPSDLVVELPSGTADRLGIKQGDSILLKYSKETLAKKYTNYLE
jgi:uncharacterized membrane protein (UPF0127 family)